MIACWHAARACSGCILIVVESKKWVSTLLIPCVQELHLELRQFRSMGKCWITKYRGTGVVNVPYIRDIAYMYGIMPNAECRMNYAVWESASSLLSAARDSASSLLSNNSLKRTSPLQALRRQRNDRCWMSLILILRYTRGVRKNCNNNEGGNKR